MLTFPSFFFACSLHAWFLAKVVGNHVWKESKNIGHMALRDARVTINDEPTDVFLFNPSTEAFIYILHANIHKKLRAIKAKHWNNVGQKVQGGEKAAELEGEWTSQNGGSKIYETFDRVGVKKHIAQKNALKELRKSSDGGYEKVDDLIMEEHRKWKNITASSPKKKKEARRNRRTQESAAIRDEEIAEGSDSEDDFSLGSNA